jgi:hypothetical protein
VNYSDDDKTQVVDDTTQVADDERFQAILLTEDSNGDN